MSDLTASEHLQNQFLIAMPQMTDPFFSNTVTYMWKHSEEGALGIVINKPLEVSIADVFNELDIVCDPDEPLFKSKKVLAGGPVEKDKGFIIHDASGSWESSIEISPEISICTSKTILQDIAIGKGPENYVVALGCAGWESGQLEQEMINNAWLTVPADSEIIFSGDYKLMAKKAAASIGIDLSQISPAAGHS